MLVEDEAMDEKAEDDLEVHEEVGFLLLVVVFLYLIRDALILKRR